MSAAIKEVVSMIESIAPPQMAYEWDNSGLLIKCSDRVSKMLITLDVTSETIEEAVQSGCDMILSHHPLIFSAIRSVSIDEYTNAIVMQLIKRGISLYSAHTSFDRAKGGLNDVLAEKLGLIDIETIEGPGEGLMRIGKLDRLYSRGEFIAKVKTVLGCDKVIATDCKLETIEKVAVIGGSGGDYVAVAKTCGAQVLVTGEAKHSHHLEAKGFGVLIIEAGHYETEKLFAEVLLSGLQLRIDEVQLQLGLKISEQCSAPYSVV